MEGTKRGQKRALENVRRAGAEFERAREEKIARNRDVLARLGIGSIAAKVAAA
jgi:hypothetical protein